MNHLEICLIKFTWNRSSDGRASGGLLSLSLDWKWSEQRLRVVMENVHTVVDRLLCSSDSGIQLIVASLREFDNEFPINHEPRINSHNRRSQRRMRNLQGVCKRDKMRLRVESGGGLHT